MNLLRPQVSARNPPDKLFRDERLAPCGHSRLASYAAARLSVRLSRTPAFSPWLSVGVVRPARRPLSLKPPAQPRTAPPAEAAQGPLGPAGAGGCAQKQREAAKGACHFSERHTPFDQVSLLSSLALPCFLKMHQKDKKYRFGVLKEKSLEKTSD